MRICLLSYRSYRYSGGQGIYLLYLSRSLRDLGHQVDVISGPPYPDLDDGIRLIKLPSLDLYSISPTQRLFQNLRKLRTFPSLVEWLGNISGYFSEPLAFGMRAHGFMRNGGRDKYDIVHDNQTLAYGILKIQDLGLPVVETIHHPVTIDRDLAIKAAASMTDRLGLRRWFSFVSMQIKVARKLRFIITVSQTASRHIAQTFGISEDKLRVIYNGIDTDTFSPSATADRLNNRLLVVLSRDTAVKGLKYALQALAVLRQKFDLELIVITGTTDSSMAQKLATDLGVSHYVKFMTGLDTTQLVSQYRLATITVVPSIYEGFGLPAAEAMACGTPVVCTTAGALPEVVADAGISVPPADADALAKAIAELIINPNRRQQLSEMGRRRVINRFSWRNTAKRTLEVYSEAIEFSKFLNRLK